jgi:hypothetical protein
MCPKKVLEILDAPFPSYRGDKRTGYLAVASGCPAKDQLSAKNPRPKQQEALP